MTTITTPVTSGILRDFEPGECVVVSRTTWWHGHSHELHEVRDDLPEMGAESPETPRLDDDGDDEELEEHESWRSLIQTKIDALTSDETADDETTDDTEDMPDESLDDAEGNPVPDVWALEDDVTPSRTYTESFWVKSLDRLDLQERPITEKQNVDAMRDIAAMLDDRVLSMPDSMVVTEIRECLTEITAQTGLSPEDTLEVALEYTETLAMNESFQEQFVTEWAHSPRAPQAGTDHPLQQTTPNTAVSSPTTEADTTDSDEHAQDDSRGDREETPADSGDGLDEQQYTLEDIDDALPDETPDKDTSDTDSQSPDSGDQTSGDGDADDDGSVDYGRFM